MDQTETLAARIQSVRKVRGLTQAQLAERARMERTDINSVEKGRLRLGPARLRRIADALGVSVLELQPEAQPDVRALLLADRLEELSKNQAEMLENQKLGLRAQDALLTELQAIRAALDTGAEVGRTAPRRRDTR